MNKGDTEIMLKLLADAGHELVSDTANADLAIVNTCAVKGPTKRRVLHRLQQLKQLNGKQVVVAGCLPLIDLKSIENLGTFAGMITCHSVDSIADVVQQIVQGKTDVRVLKRAPCEKPCLGKFRLSNVSAIVAISEGCVSNCSYCSVRIARGKLHSFDAKAILSEIERAVQSGYREILLTSQDTAAYGLDRGSSLPHLLGQIIELKGKFRVRIGMMNPANAKRILPGLLDAYASDKIYKFLHLPIQSGDDGILAKMRREYTVREFLEIVETFRSRFEDLHLATDIIVGFPCEGEQEFKHTCELIEKIKPDKVNLTRFSPMPGTDAAQMPQIQGREAKRRSRLLSTRCRSIGYEQNKRYVGRSFEGLVVKRGEKGGWVVRLPNYKPMIVPNAELGSFVKTRVTDSRPTYLLGEVVS